MKWVFHESHFLVALGTEKPGPDEFPQNIDRKGAGVNIFWLLRKDINSDPFSFIFSCFLESRSGSELVDVDGDRHRSDLPSFLVDNGGTELRDILSVLLLDVVDQQALRSHAVRLLPLGFVALHVVASGVGLPNIEADIVHHEDFDDDPVRSGADPS